MRAGRNEVVDIFRKWLDESSPIRVQGSFPAFAFGLWGRIVSITPTKLSILSLETESELVLQLTPELEFGYGDNRTVTGDEKQFSECIVIFFGQNERDNIALAALKPS